MQEKEHLFLKNISDRSTRAFKAVWEGRSIHADSDFVCALIARASLNIDLLETGVFAFLAARDQHYHYRKDWLVSRWANKSGS